VGLVCVKLDWTAANTARTEPPGRRARCLASEAGCPAPPSQCCIQHLSFAARLAAARVSSRRQTSEAVCGARNGWHEQQGWEPVKSSPPFSP